MPTAPTPKMIDFAIRLAGERELPEEQGWSPESMKRMVQMKERIDERQPSKRDVHTMIDWLLRQPEAPKAPYENDVPTELVGMGVYRLDGQIVVVKPNKQKTRCYALKLVESPPRMTEAGEVVDFELEFERGLIFQLREKHRMTLADAAQYLIRYGKCIICKRTLKAARTLKTVEETGLMVGPVCRKYFTS